MQRSDLPHVGKLPPELQRRAVDAMWRAYRKAERRPVLRPNDACPPSWVATMVEMLEAALGALDTPPFELGPGSPAVALREGGPWAVVTDVRMPPGVALVGAPEQIERVLSDWTRGSFPRVPLEVKHDEVVALRVERPE